MSVNRCPPCNRVVARRTAELKVAWWRSQMAASPGGVRGMLRGKTRLKGKVRLGYQLNFVTLRRSLSKNSRHLLLMVLILSI
jgi:hypothetical protein